ncbi:condensation domain-containing protein, partial [Actinomadura rubrobrunea]|uniref:condensation domain-containing protein n=1 Tax=Actinomadura rubrobrunea TaxID=115335 RepID=UPI002555C1DA
DYTLWQQRQLLAGENTPGTLAHTQLQHWRTTLTDLPEQIPLPTDRPRRATYSFDGDIAPVRLDAELHAALVALAGECRATLFMVIQAGLAALLSRLGAGDDIPLGSPIAGRTDDALDDLVGFFVNTLVLRADLSGNPTFRQLLERIRTTDLAAYAHQDIPFERLVEILNPERSTARNPLFQVLVVLQNAAEPAYELPGLHVQPIRIAPGVTKFDLSLSLDERRQADGTPAGLDGYVEYSSDLFDASTIESLIARFTAFLREAVADPDRPIGDIELLTPRERTELLPSWNDTADGSSPACWPDLFEARAGAAPEAPAVLFEGSTLSYGELNAQANRLARLLTARGVGPEHLVAVA